MLEMKTSNELLIAERCLLKRLSEAVLEKLNRDKLSINEVCVMAEVSKKTVEKMRDGENVTLKNLAKVADVLNIEIIIM